MPCLTNIKLFSCNMGFPCILHFFPLNPKHMCLSHSRSLFYSLYPPSLTYLSGLCAHALQPIPGERHLQIYKLSALDGPEHVAFL